METKLNNIVSMKPESECNGILILRQILDKRRINVNIQESLDGAYNDYSDYSDHWGDLF